MSKLKVLLNGIIKENPVFVLLLGMCPTLGTTTSALNGMSMGLATMIVLTLSNVTVSMISNLIADKVRIPIFVVLSATYTTVIQYLLNAYMPSVYDTLGLFLPLIAINCIIMARAEAVATKNGVMHSLFDGIGIGLGFTLALTVLGFVRELFGNGSVFGHKFIEGDGIMVFILAPGAFITLAYLIVVFNKIKDIKKKKV